MTNPPAHPTESAGTVPACLVGPRCVWIALIVWLGISVPLFVGMPLNSDTALYDVHARSVLDGAVAYRDIFEPNFPGVLWIHMGIRSAFGWSSEAMRAVDLVVLGSILWLWAGAFERRKQVMPVFLLAVTLFYLTRNEWCHAQRDTWMLLPAGLAMVLRCRRPCGSSSLLALLEGFCWGCAVWIKPHVAVPAAAVMLVDLRERSIREALPDILVVILGGVMAAIPGIAWLSATGAGEHFWHIMVEWNPEYLMAGRERMSLGRWVTMSRRFAPWPGLHVVAVPVATAVIFGCRKTDSVVNTRWRTLLSSCYLAWLVQSVVLQHALDYIHVPAIILGLAVLCGHPWQLPVILRRSGVAAFIIFSLVWTPFFAQQRLRQWPVVLQKGSTLQVRAALAHGNLPDWEHLGKVIGFLQERGVINGDVTCMNVHSVHIYNETHTRPSTRYWSVAILQDLFPQRAADIAAAVNESQHRYVVTEANESDLIRTAHRQPWMDTLIPVFESGSYRVLRVGSGEGEVASTSR